MANIKRKFYNYLIGKCLKKKIKKIKPKKKHKFPRFKTAWEIISKT